MYYTAELQNAASIRKPEPCAAKTLAGAKRVASRRQTFAGTTLAVYDNNGYKIAVKDSRGWFNYSRGWFNYSDESPLNCAPGFDPQ